MSVFPKQNRWVALAFATIIMVGAFLRFYALNEAPPGLSNDEAFNSISAALSLGQGEYSLFYIQGRWALTGPFIWLLAASIEVFGNNLWAIRFVPAMIGTMALIGFFWLCLEYWREHKHVLQLSLLSSAFLAVSFWHMHTTRLIFHGTLATLCEVLALWSLLVALRTGKRLHYTLAGLLFISGIYSYWQYIPFMLLPGFMLLHALRQRKISLSNFAIFAAVALTAATPFIMALLQQDLFHRVSQLTVTNQVRDDVDMWDNVTHLVLEVKKNAAYTIGMLFLDGDRNWRHNYNSQASLGFLAQLSVLLALVFARGREYGENPKMAMALGWFVVTLLPAILTSQAVPHSWRGNTMVLPLSMIAGYGVYHMLYAVNLPVRQILTSLLVVAFAVSAYASYNEYFLEWATNQRTRDAFDMGYVHDPFGNNGPLYKDFNFVREAMEINARPKNAP